MYQAEIFYNTNEDSYTEGELLDGYGTDWIETLTADTKEELKALIAQATYCNWEDIELGNYNEYPDANEYWAGYMANADNEGEATEAELEAWKRGKTRLWAVSCHILVSEVTKRKAVL